MAKLGGTPERRGDRSLERRYATLRAALVKVALGAAGSLLAFAAVSYVDNGSKETPQVDFGPNPVTKVVQKLFDLFDTDATPEPTEGDVFASHTPIDYHNDQPAVTEPTQVSPPQTIARPTSAPLPTDVPTPPNLSGSATHAVPKAAVGSVYQASN